MCLLTHGWTVYPQSGHLSTLDQAQSRESLPAKEWCLTYWSATSTTSSYISAM